MGDSVQIVDIYQYKTSIPIETLLSGYSEEEILAQSIDRIFPISIPFGTSLGGVKELIENYINIPKSLQRISFHIGEEIDDESLLLPQQITTLHVGLFQAAPANNNNNNINNNYDYGVEKSIIEFAANTYNKQGKQRDETGKTIPLKIAYLDTKRIEMDAKSSYKLSDIKDEIRGMKSELSKYNNTELVFLSDPTMKDENFLSEYLDDIFNEGNNAYCFRLVVRPEDGAFTPSVAKGLVEQISGESAKKDLLKLIDEAKGKDIHVFPVKEIPGNYWWVLKIKDYSEKAERNKELVTEKQKEVIYNYTGDSWYAKINFLLATLTTAPKIERDFIETLILACCDSYQTNLPDQVVRMTSFSDEELAFYKSNEGETVCMPSFMSTSSIEMAAFGTVRIVVQLTRGKRRGAMLIQDYSKYKKESEILLSAFSFYKIISVDLTTNPIEIHLAYLDAIHHYRAEKKN